VSANGLRHEFLMSANDRKCQRRLLAKELLSHVLPEKASSDQEHHQLLLVVTGEETRPGQPSEQREECTFFHHPCGKGQRS
jgi:hypothetical protein